jgi:hypothetical protein
MVCLIFSRYLHFLKFKYDWKATLNVVLIQEASYIYGNKIDNIVICGYKN